MTEEEYEVRRINAIANILINMPKKHRNAVRERLEPRTLGMCGGLVAVGFCTVGQAIEAVVEVLSRN